MGVDTKSLRLRIHSVDSMLHLTKAMGLVASSKFRYANRAMANGRQYVTAVRNMINALTVSPECSRSPYMREASGERTRLIVIAGDRGLCGGYNSNVFRLTAQYPGAEIIPIGKRAFDRFGGAFLPSEGFDRMDGYAIADRMCNDFADGAFDRLGIVFSRYVSMLTQEACVEWLLPLQKNEQKVQSGVIFEPNENEILNYAVREYVGGMITALVHESFACEVAARRMAMDSAGKNAQEMISDLQLQYNRARQGAITQEITEIVAGSGG